ncbi:Holliday junction branch migration protein RuvA [Adlercreutzia aquisgranensis]|uniref:Holliday junction branch migration protein RuvA n=1 Tax=Adlercreutzia aquisgranensis TaxID=2941323 RepID=UPI00203E2F58|nr:Holliday junction branch migration protein RuvA [Adlercreutzia aquisgranensis]
MIAFLEGAVAGRSAQAAYLNVGGVGYQVFMAASSLAKLPETGQRASVLTYLQVSENGVSLYGFLSQEEKDLFERLIGVSGVGPKVALSALSTFSPSQLAQAVASQDTALIAKIPGVGKKTASRIVVDLKGSLDELGRSLFAAQDAEVAPAGASRAAEDLLALGFTADEAELALRGAPEGASEQQLLQYALKRLG